MAEVDQLPQNALAGAITQETKQTLLLVPIQPFDGIVQPGFGSHVTLGWQRVVDAARPPLLQER